MILETLVIALAGGLGAAARFLLDGASRSRTRLRFPVATSAINVLGSLLLGLLVGAASGGLIAAGWQALVGTGFLGGFTTFSAAAAESVRLLQDRRYVAALLHAVGMLVAAVAAAALGLAAGLAL
jgi:CrcB protein